MSLTAEQRTAIDHDGHVMLSACPGSGKTHVIVSKLLRAVDTLRGTPRAAACITYTNAAVLEIEARLRRQLQVGDETHFEISTIHAFCLQYVFRPYAYRVKGYAKGFEVLSQDNPAFAKFVEATTRESGRYNLRQTDYDEFAQIQINETGTPIGSALTNGAISTREAKRYWQMVREAGYADFALIVYFSLLLLKKFPEIADHLASRFAFILIDEFQDTSDLQVEILTLIASRQRTRFFLVGDPNQSIFSFAGARPDLADVFAKRINARTDLSLSGNFRCSPQVIAHAETLIPRAPPMTAVGKAKVYTETPKLQKTATPFELLTDYFLPALDELKIPLGQAAILAPTWFSLFPLGRKLREYGIAVVGPGARPYKRNRLFAPLAEQICGYLIEPKPDALVGIERRLFETVLNATAQPRFDIFSYDGRAVVFRLLAEARRLEKLHTGAEDWLKAAVETFGIILREGGLLTAPATSRLTSSVDEILGDIRSNRVDVANLTLADLGLYASHGAALKLSTLHNAKGREFDAIAMIDLHNGRIPFFRAETQEQIEEARRLFYVGITRAKRYLLYGIDRTDLRNAPSPFLTTAGGLGLC
ncbi:ATP-dependent helicase [Bradyrhizobium sp. AZCC 1721]|uniref:ATP-dependent helicase n=1 Tax=Bradyrhizobium sp. AZCC 1721 TaxID=3117016 RepID=UPI002FF05CC7